MSPSALALDDHALALSVLNRAPVPHTPEQKLTSLVQTSAVVVPSSTSQVHRSQRHARC